MTEIDKSKNKSAKKLGIIIAASLAVIAVAVVCIVLAHNGYLATTMRLLKVEGTVTIEDSKGGSKPVTDNIRFQSGDALITGTDGIASVGLDDSKIVTLQNDSRAEFAKKNKQLELKLTKGAVFFNVTQKLKSDEKFEVKTSTMTAGIRGTSGFVYYDAADEGRESLIITDGAVEVSATNPDTGETKTARIEGGQRIKVYLYSDRTENSVEFEVDKVTEEDLSAFTLSMLAENEELMQRVCDYTGWDKDKLKKLLKEVDDLSKVTEPSDTTTTTTTAPKSSTSETPEDTTTTSTTARRPKKKPTRKPTRRPTRKPTRKPKKKKTSRSYKSNSSVSQTPKSVMFVP